MTMMRDLDDLPAELEIFEGNVALHRQDNEDELNEAGEAGVEGEEGEEDEERV